MYVTVVGALDAAGAPEPPPAAPHAAATQAVSPAPPATIRRRRLSPRPPGAPGAPDPRLAVPPFPVVSESARSMAVPPRPSLPPFRQTSTTCAQTRLLVVDK